MGLPLHATQASNRPAVQSPAVQPSSRPAGQPTGPEPGSELIVTLMTYEQGERIYERYGHNAIWIHNAATGEDQHWDYGRFNFDAPHFLLNFIQGKMWYAMGFESNAAGMVELYVSQGRKAWMQELNIAPAERLKLRELLTRNYRPENRNYAYDYYRDNCSTRIRDALDAALGGAIRRYGAEPSGWTWREETRRLNQHNPALSTGLLIVLGQPVDQEMSRWERMFLPMRLREYLDSMTVAGPGGSQSPAVVSERLVSEGGRWPAPDRPANWLGYYLLAGILVGGLLLVLGRTPVFLPVATGWMLLVGLLGGFMLWVWLFSFHHAGYRNENLFLFNLLALALALVLPFAARARPRATAAARWLSYGVVGVALMGLVVKALPWFHQSNLEVIGLVLPIHAGVFGGLRRRLVSPSLASV